MWVCQAPEESHWAVLESHIASLSQYSSGLARYERLQNRIAGVQARDPSASDTRVRAVLTALDAVTRSLSKGDPSLEVLSGLEAQVDELEAHAPADSNSRLGDIVSRLQLATSTVTTLDSDDTTAAVVVGAKMMVTIASAALKAATAPTGNPHDVDVLDSDVTVRRCAVFHSLACSYDVRSHR